MAAVEQLALTNMPHSSESMVPEIFAPERCWQTASPEEAREACMTDFRYERSPVAVDQIFVEEDFRHERPIRLAEGRGTPTEARIPTA